MDFLFNFLKIYIFFSVYTHCLSRSVFRNGLIFSSDKAGEGDIASYGNDEQRSQAEKDAVYKCESWKVMGIFIHGEKRKEHSMSIKVTFDTNVFERFIRLEEDDNKIYYKKILEAIKSKIIRGYFSDTYITLEGVQNSDRVQTFGSRKIKTVVSLGKKPNTIDITVGASMCQPDLHECHSHTIKSLSELGVKGLKGIPYLGDNFPVPSNIDIYEPITSNEFSKIAEKMITIQNVIVNKNNESGRGNNTSVGKCRAQELGLKWLTRSNENGKAWYEGLALYQDKKESEQVKKAIAEWADGESVIRHFGYGNNYFCTLDEGKTTVGASILDCNHKYWLKCNFGVEFVTPKELFGIISNLTV